MDFMLELLGRPASPLAAPPRYPECPECRKGLLHSQAGEVLLLRDTDGDGVADMRKTVARIARVHGLLLHAGKLYMVSDRALDVADVQSDGTLSTPRRLLNDLPEGGNHPRRTLGMGPWRAFFAVSLPLARPALGTLAVYSFLQTYNQYLWPLLITNDQQMRTVQIGIALLQDEERFMFNIVMAGVVIILVPTFVLFVFGNRQLIRGLTAGAVKG